jgi:hypothetical protein
VRECAAAGLGEHAQGHHTSLRGVAARRGALLLWLLSLGEQRK